ncbi:MAG: hypothetical protein ACSLFM_04610 [Tepidiformaceae bacterium]
MPRKPGPTGPSGRRLGNVAHEHADGKDPHPRWIDTDAPDDSDQGRFHLPVYNPTEHTVPSAVASPSRSAPRTLFYGAVAAGATFAAISALLHSLTRRN